MTSPTVVGIFIAAEEASPVVSLDEVRAVPGKGLEGDRYYARASSDAGDHEPNEEITLIASEGLERAEKKDGLVLEPGEHRRNIVTQGIDLNSLVGAELTIAGVRIRAMELNPPCRYLAEMTGKPVVKSLIDDGGVRGEILTEGTIRVGDTIEVAHPNPV